MLIISCASRQSKTYIIKAMAKTSSRPRRSSPLRLPGAFELFSPSKELVLKNIWIFGPLYAIPLVFWIHNWLWSATPGQVQPWWHDSGGISASWPGGPLPTYSSFLIIGFTFVWFLIVAVIGTIAQIMAQSAQLSAAQNKHFDFETLWVFVREMGWRMLGLYIVMGLIILVGFILLLIPGLFMIRRYIFAPYVMIDKKCSIREALDQSAALGLKNTGSVWGVMGVMLLISLVNILPIIGGLGSFVLGVLYSVAPALRYEQLKKI